MYIWFHADEFSENVTKESQLAYLRTFREIVWMLEIKQILVHGLGLFEKAIE